MSTTEFSIKKAMPRIVLLTCSFLLACSNVEMDLPKSDDENLGLPIEIGAIERQSDIALKRAVPSETSYDDVFHKTLFNPDREFVETEQVNPEIPIATPERQTIEIPNLELIGTLKTANSSSYAFIRTMGSGKKAGAPAIAKYTLGQWIGDYLISKIDASRVTLMKGNEVAVLQLKPSANPAGRSPKAPGRQAAGKNPRTSSGGSSRPAFPSQEMEMGERGKASSKGIGQSRMQAESKSAEEMEKEKSLAGSSARRSSAPSTCGF
ncbi:hypothetical protein JW823_09585 [bacterium]|nr:hypothetical protein [candidate division CSSED10-310 bacterium]